MSRSKIVIILFFVGALLGVVGYFIGYSTNVRPFQQRIDELQSQLTNLQEQLETKENEMKQLDQEITKLKTEISVLQGRTQQLKSWLLKEIEIKNFAPREIRWDATEHLLVVSFDYVVYNGMNVDIHIPWVQVQVLNVTAADGSILQKEAFQPMKQETEIIITANGTFTISQDFEIETDKPITQMGLEMTHYIKELDAEWDFTLVLTVGYK